MLVLLSRAVLAACVCCVLMCGLPAQSAAQANASAPVVALPPVPMLEWRIAPALPSIPEVAARPAGAFLLKVAPAQPRQEWLSFSVSPYSAQESETWLQATLERARALEAVARLAEEKAAAELEADTPAPEAPSEETPVVAETQPAPGATPDAGSLLDAPVAKEQGATPDATAFLQAAPATKAPEQAAPATKPDGQALLQAPVAKAPAPQETKPNLDSTALQQAPVAVAPPFTEIPQGTQPPPKPAPSLSPQALLQAPVTQTKPADPPAPATPPAGSTPNLQAAPAPKGSTPNLLATPAPTKPAPASPEAAKPADAPGKQVAAVTPRTPTRKPSRLSPTAPQGPIATVNTPAALQAAEAFKHFCSTFVKRLDGEYVEGTKKKKKVLKQDGAFVAQYRIVDKSSIRLQVKPTTYSHTPFVGVLVYSEALMQAQGPTAQAAKAGTFKVVDRTKVREFFRYAKEKWQF